MDAALATGDLVAGADVGRWRVAKLIGRGGTSTVYEGRDGDGARAAVKVMRPELTAHPGLADRFLREAATIAALDHPCIPRVLEHGRMPDGRMFLAMELLHGRTLADAMAADRVGAGDAAVILDQLCGVLRAAHALGVVHRDLKPENIFLVAEEPMQIKLVDWGIAKSLGLEADLTALTRTGTIIGTPRYLAPEQARALPIDTRVDIYALGLIAYELLVGFYPFDGGSVAETLMMQMVQPPPSPRRFWPDIPDALERLLVAMLRKDPTGRPPLDEIQRVLQTSLRGRGEERLDGFRSGTYDDVSTSVGDAPGRPTVRVRRLTRP